LGLKTAFQGQFLPFFMILSLRMRRNTINSTSGFKMDLKFGLRVPKNMYIRGTRALKLHLKGIFSIFRNFITAHAQKHHLFYFRFQNGPQIRTPRTEKHILTRNMGLNTTFQRHFAPFFMILLLRKRRNTINSTSGFKMDLKFGLPVPKNMDMRGN
jgi:hypothetical protein